MTPPDDFTLELETGGLDLVMLGTKDAPPEKRLKLGDSRTAAPSAVSTFVALPLGSSTASAWSRIARRLHQAATSLGLSVDIKFFLSPGRDGCRDLS